MGLILLLFLLRFHDRFNKIENNNDINKNNLNNWNKIKNNKRNKIINKKESKTDTLRR